MHHNTCIIIVMQNACIIIKSHRSLISDPRVLNDLGCNAVVASSSGSAGSGIDRNQRFVSIVDERGRTQLKAGRELPV